MHTNLFSYVSTSDEVYRTMQEHMKRDERYTKACFYGAAICLSLALRYGAADGWPWLIGGIFCSVFGLVYFVDNSNRNFYLHMVDWVEATQAKSENRNES
jgi:hypothetical protein